MGIRKGRCLWSSSPRAGIIDPAGIMNGSDCDDHDCDDGSELGVSMTKLLKILCYFSNLSCFNFDLDV